MTPFRLTLIAAGLLAVGLLSGCTPATTVTSTPGASAPPGASSSSPAPASHQRPLTAVPASCPDAAEISVSLHVNLPDVYPDQEGVGLICTYVDAAQGNASKGVLILFGQAGDSVESWSAATRSATPSAVAVSGVGDAAFYFVDIPPGTSALYFMSGPVAVHITSSFSSPQKDLVALAVDQILVPDN